MTAVEEHPVRGPRHGKRGRVRSLRSWRVILVTAVVALLVALGASVAYGHWHASDTAVAGVISAGDLELRDDGLSWQTEIPCGTDRQSGTDWDSLTGFIAMPGDVVEVTQDVTATLSGDNLAAQLTVSWSGQAPENVSATYRVFDGDAQVAPASGAQAVGTPITLDAMTAATVPADLSVRVRIEFGGPNAYTSDIDAGPGDQPRTAIPGLTVALHQVRSGEGFIP